jgi:hypothetical protein
MLAVVFQPSEKLTQTPIYADYLQDQLEHLYYKKEEAIPSRMTAPLREEILIWTNLGA